jgi:phosphoserine phosphatase
MTISTDFETATAQINDPLPSWHEGTAKQAIINFVQATTDYSSSNYVEPDDRIATFDQDGTLWVEHPFYSQAMFALDRLKSLAPQYPEWQTKEPFKSILEGNQDAIAKLTEGDLVQIVAATHAGMTTEEFIDIAKNWQVTAKHPRFQKLYTELVYQPMREVLQYLQANGFKTYIVTGGGQEFVRIYSDRVYDIPIERVIGSSIVTKYDHQDGKPVLMREPEVFFINDHAGKPTGINLFIGKRPTAAFGNSDGDRQMLEYTQAGDGMRLSMLILHDDEKREYAYGPAQGLPDTKVGRFTQTLYDQSQKDGWIIVSIKNDWKRIFSF